MADQDMERLDRKVDEIAEKLDTLSASFDKRFGEVDKRFDKALVEIDGHFVEQRQYTELAFDMLRSEMREGFAGMRGGFAEMRSGFEQIDQRLAIFIETQGGVNFASAKALAEHSRRIRALEHARSRRRS